MTGIRTLIVDDEPLARRGVRQLLAPYPDLVVVGECRDGHEALRSLARLEPDLVFLDVQMPGVDGLEVIRRFGAARMPAVVFVTAHDEYAVRAFEAAALDYLVKPLGEARFGAAVARVRERLRTAHALELAERLSALLASTGGEAATCRDGSTGGFGTAATSRGKASALSSRRSTGRIAVRSGSGDLLLDPEEIDWAEADDDAVWVHARGRRYRAAGPLSALAARLDPARFIRVHRKALVRLESVRRLDGEAGATGGRLTLLDGTELPVSRRRLVAVRGRLRATGGRG